MQNPDGQPKFVEIQQAWEIIGDPDKRELYDSSGGSDNYYRQQQQYQDHQQQQQYQHHWGGGGGWGGWSEQHYENILPSSTQSLSSTNIRQLVFSSDKAWLIQLYSHDGLSSKSFSSVWEGLWKSLGGEGGDIKIVQVG